MGDILSLYLYALLKAQHAALVGKITKTNCNYFRSFGAHCLYVTLRYFGRYRPRIYTVFRNQVFGKNLVSRQPLGARLV